MLLYPGGTYTDPSSMGYDFTRNFFSDLGRLTTFTEEPKHLTMVLFAIPLVLTGMSLPFLFLSLIRSMNFPLKGESLAAFIAALITGTGYVGIAFTPWDIAFPQHIFFVRAAFIAFFITVIFFTHLTWQSALPRRIPVILFGYTLLQGLYLLLLFFGPDFRSHQGLFIQALGQKIIIYSQITVLIMVAHALLNYDQNYV